MSGHSKWATIKHKKAAIDKVRGKTFAKMAILPFVEKALTHLLIALIKLSGILQ